MKNAESNNGEENLEDRVGSNNFTKKVSLLENRFENIKNILIKNN